jgi:hypothetical protein
MKTNDVVIERRAPRRWARQAERDARVVPKSVMYVHKGFRAAGDVS